MVVGLKDQLKEIESENVKVLDIVCNSKAIYPGVITSNYYITRNYRNNVKY